MDNVNQESTLVALDIGSSKISVAVAEPAADGSLSILGFGKVTATGIHCGSIQDVELAVDAIRSAVEEASQTSRRKITQVSVALTGKHLHSVNKVGKLVLPDKEVSSADVKRATRLAMTFDPKTDAEGEDDKLVSHVIKGYTIDNDDAMMDDPVGMEGNVLKAHAHLAIGSDSVVLNLGKCIKRAGLDPEGLVLQPWASAAGVLTPTEKELGVIAIDIGAGTADIACFEKGQIAHTAVLQLGGETITRDIAGMMGCSLDAAEDIKISYGHVYKRSEDAYEVIRYIKEATGTEETFRCEDLTEIITLRVREIFRAIVEKQLKNGEWNKRAAAGVVLTGGFARTPGIEALLKDFYKLPVRIGMPSAQTASGVGLVSPEDATVVGVLSETLRRRMLAGSAARTSGTFGGIINSVRRVIFGDFAD